MMEYLLSFFITIEIFGVNLLLYRFITNEKIKFSLKSFVFMVLTTLLISYLTITEQYFLKLLVILISTSCLNSMLFKEDILKTFYHSFFIWLFLILSDIVFSVIILANNLSYYDISSNYLFRFICTFPVSLLQCLFLFISKKSIIKIYRKYFFRVSQNATFIFCLSFFILFFSLLAFLNAFSSYSKMFSILTIFSLLIFICLVVYIIKIIIKSYNLSLLNKNIINENKLIREMSKNDAIFKHNLINNLLGIEVVANEKAKLLIDELIIKYKNDYEKISNINELPSGIQGLIYKKIYLKNISNLNFRVENGFEGDIEKLMTSKNYNLLSETIGILLDNALEAVENCPNKIIVIDMEKTDDNIYFEIKNSFDSQIDFEELGSAKYTTKKSGHGIGINYLLENKSVELKSSIVNNLFQVEAIIKIKK